MGIGAWIAVIVVAVIFVCSLAYLIYKKVTGKGGCDCGCDSCPHCSHCGTQKDAAVKEPTDEKK